MVNTKIIADLPMELGIKRTYKGYFFLIAALELAITDQKNLLYMSNLFSRSSLPVMTLHTAASSATSERRSTPVGIHRIIVKNCWQCHLILYRRLLP